jgi:hypothetical protein
MASMKQRTRAQCVSVAEPSTTFETLSLFLLGRSFPIMVRVMLKVHLMIPSRILVLDLVGHLQWNGLDPSSHPHQDAQEAQCP